MSPLEAGPFPRQDGWSGLYRLFAWAAPQESRRRRIACRYYLPSAAERWNRGRCFRWLGVHLFGSVIPTGGIRIRRWTGARMTPYTLSATSLNAAREFFYRTCVFESLHLPFFLALSALALQRAAVGRIDLALENTIWNLVCNIYPILHHRRTRLRIVQLLERRRSMDG